MKFKKFKIVCVECGADDEIFIDAKHDSWAESSPCVVEIECGRCDNSEDTRTRRA